MPSPRSPFPSRRLVYASLPPLLLLGSPLLTTSLALAASPTGDASQQAGQSFEIPAGSLEQALRQFSQQTGLNLSYLQAQVSVQKTQGVSGFFTPAQALQHLLRGTGLEAFPQGRGHVISAQHEQGLSLSAIDIDGQYQQNIYTTPAAVFSVDRERLDRIPQTSPADLFRGIPGVQMGNARSGNSFDPNIRGAQGHGRVKVLLDGSDSTQSSRVTYAGNRSANYVDPDFIAGIEVEKGPGLESGGLGGTLALRTFDVRDIIIDPDKGWGLRLRGMLGDNSGSNDSTQFCRSTNINTGISSSNAISITNTTLPWCRDGITRGNNRYDMVPYASGVDIPSGNQAGSLIGAWAPLDNLELLAGYARRQSGNYTAGKQGSVDRSYPSNGGYYNDMRPKDGFSYWLPGDEIYGTFSDTQSWMGKARLMLGEHSVQLKYNHFESRHVLHANSASQVGPSYLDLFPPSSKVEQQRYGIDYRWQPDSPWFDLKADLWLAETRERLALGTYGASLTPQHIDTETLGLGLRNTSLVPLLGRTLTLKAGGNYKWEEVDSTNEVNGIEVEQYGLFASAQLPLNHWLSVDGGLRYDDYRMHLDASQSYRFAGNNSGNNTAVHGGITLQPIEPLQVFLRYAEGWRAPSSRENTLNNCAGGRVTVELYPGYWGTQCIQGLIKPEQSENIELGANLALNDVLFDHDSLGIKVSRFDNRYTDYVYGSGTSVLPIENIDKARFTGYEASLDYDAGQAFVEYAYTHYDRIQYCGGGWSNTGGCSDASGWGDLTSQYAPARHQHNATLGVRLLDRKLTLGSMATVVRGTGWEWKSLNRYEVYDLFASYAYKAVTLGLSAANLGDRYYFEAGTGAAWPLPAPGRTLRATLTLHY